MASFNDRRASVQDAIKNKADLLPHLNSTVLPQEHIAHKPGDILPHQTPEEVAIGKLSEIRQRQDLERVQADLNEEAAQARAVEAQFQEAALESSPSIPLPEMAASPQLIERKPLNIVPKAELTSPLEQQSVSSEKNISFQPQVSEEAALQLGKTLPEASEMQISPPPDGAVSPTLSSDAPPRITAKDNEAELGSEFWQLKRHLQKAV